MQRLFCKHAVKWCFSNINQMYYCVAASDNFQETPSLEIVNT